jgi:hypothetical protein
MRARHLVSAGFLLSLASGAGLAAFLGIAAAPSASAAGTTERVSVDSSGGQSDAESGWPSISSDGRFVSYYSPASNLVTGDTNNTYDTFLYDRQTGTTERISVNSNGEQGNSVSGVSSISADGRFVAFNSYASNLVAGDTNGSTTSCSGCVDVFVRDRQTGTTERVSVDSSGTEGNGNSFNPSISADGRYVAFSTSASNLVAADTNGSDDVFVHDRQTGTTERVSVDSSGGQGSAHSVRPSITPDGRFVAFDSLASNLVTGDTNSADDVFVHDRQIGTTELVSVDSNGAQGNSLSFQTQVTPDTISADGRFVVFYSYASNLVAGDIDNFGDVFVHDRQTGATERVSVDSNGAAANADSVDPSISLDGRFVAFYTFASNLVADDTNDAHDTFLHDRQTGTTERVSVDSSGGQGNSTSFIQAISADGGVIAFASYASNLVPDDTNGTSDIFVHDRQTGQAGDADGDGIGDSVDSDPGTSSDAFADGDGTSGSITDRAGLSVTIEDAASPDGVRVIVGAGSGQVTLDACGFTLMVDAVSELLVTCGSVTLNVIQGAAQVVLDGRVTVVSIPAGVSAAVTDNGDGTFLVQNVGGVGVVTVTVDGAQTIIAPGGSQSYTVNYQFLGFFSPVDNLPTLNAAKGGSAIPAKFSLGGDQGLDIFAPGYPKSQKIHCDTSVPLDTIEETVTAGSSSLSYAAGADQYHYVWKTEKAWAGTCRQLILRLNDSTDHVANFKFK